MERHRRRRAGAARYFDRAQRIWRVGTDDLRIRHRRPVCLRHEPDEHQPVPLPRRLGGHAGRQGHGAGEGRDAGRGRSEVHPARPRPVRRCDASQGVRAARRMDGAGRGALSGQPADGSGEVMAGICRSLYLQPDSI